MNNRDKTMISRCAPAFDADAQGPAEPTLLSLIAASSGTIPPSLWQEWCFRVRFRAA